MSYSIFQEPKLELNRMIEGKFTLVDSRYEDPIEYKSNEYGHKTPTIHTINYGINAHVLPQPPQPQGRVNYGSYIYNPATGSDPSHPFGTSFQPFQTATF